MYRVCYRKNHVDRTDIVIDHDTLNNAKWEFNIIKKFADLKFVRLEGPEGTIDYYAPGPTIISAPPAPTSSVAAPAKKKVKSKA